jgi:hypothetical protein
MQPAKVYHPHSFTCGFPGCEKSCHTCGGLQQQGRVHHGRVAQILAPFEDQNFGGQPEDDTGPNNEPGRRRVRYHPILSSTL